MKFRSKFEKDLWECAKRNKKKMEYETLNISYSVNHNYKPDFILPNGIIVEAKGYFDTRAQVKMKNVKRTNPELDIRFVFMNSRNKLNKSSKMTYADWCEKYQFPFADGMIPLEWWQEK